MDRYFTKAGDLTDSNLEINENFIKNYLLEIVSETSLDNEDVNIIGAGEMVISFNEVQKMVEAGCYNILKAEYLNPEMIIIKFKKYQKENSRKI